MKERQDIPTGWALAIIPDIIPFDGIFIDGDWIESKDQDKNGEIRLIQLADIGDGDFRDKSERFLTKESAYNLNCTFLKEGDILIARMPDPIGRACIFPLKGEEKFVTAVDVAIIRTGNNGMLNKYLKYIINSPKIRNRIEELQTGTTRKRISRSNLGTIKLPIAPLPEQHRIVTKLDELFSELEKGREQLEFVQQKLKIYRQSLLKAAFEGKLTEEWRKKQANLKTPQQLINEINQYRKENYEKKLKNYEDGKIKSKPKKPEKVFFNLNSEIELPENWIELDLSIVSKVISGFAFKSDDFISIGIPVVKIGNVGYSEFHWKEQQYLPESFLTNYSEYVVRSNDLLIALTRPITNNTLKSCFYPKDSRFGLLNQRVAKINTEQFLRKDFLAFYFQTESFKKYVESKLSITLQPNLSPKDLELAVIPLCSIEEQKIIVDELNVKFSYCSYLEEKMNQKIFQIEPLRQSILQKAFSGQLLPQDPNDEPVRILLERIKKVREEYLKNRGKDKKTAIRKTKISMVKELKTIMQLLQDSKKPMAAKALWQASEHKENIDEFYAELKKLIEKGEIKEADRKGKESYITLADAK